MSHTKQEQPMADKSHVSVRLRKETLEGLDRLAKETRRSKSFLIAEAVESLLDKDAWQVGEIKKAVAKADAGGPFVRHDDITAWLRSWGGEGELPPPKATR